MTKRVLKRVVLSATVAVLTAIVSMMAVPQSESMLTLPNDSGEWFVAPDHVGRTVTLPIRVTIDSVGTFIVDPVGISIITFISFCRFFPTYISCHKFIFF